MISILKNQLEKKIYYLIKKFYPFPIIDKLPDDICEYLNVNKTKFLESIKTGVYRKKYDGYQEDYEKWLKTSDYYFYDLCRWHLKEKSYFVLKSFLQPKNLNILDFGSGIGTRALIHSKKNQMTLVELNKRMLDFSKWRFGKYNRKGKFFQYIPEDFKYDIIMAIDVVGHLTDPINIISQIYSALKKNGILSVKIDTFEFTSKKGIHRNKEINFPKLFKELGFKKIDLMHYKKSK